MIPIKIFSKLARSRSHVALATKTFVTTGGLWKQNQGDRKSGDDFPEEVSKKQQQSCGPRVDKHLEEHDVKKHQKPTDDHDYLEKKKQGEGSSCGPIKSPDTHHKTRKTEPLDSGGDIEEKGGSKNIKPRGCSCPPYATPKYVAEKESQKSTSLCPEKDVPKSTKQDSKCEPQRSRADPCESRKGSREEDKCNTQKRNEPCEKNSSAMKMCPPGKGTSTGDDAPKKSNYCGPVESSYKDASREDKDVCSKYDKQRKDSCGPKTSYNRETECEDPCKKPSRNDEDCLDMCKEKRDPCEPKTSRNKCLDRENECDDRSDSCDPCATPSSSCPDECEQAKTQCETSRGNDCPEEECPDERNYCPEDPCKKEIAIPELPPCCKVMAAKECVCKLKELQRQWEEVIAAQEGGGKGDFPKPQECVRTDCAEPATRIDKRSNMIYVVLSAILAAVVYYTYNGDFEPEELFWEDEEVKKDDIEEDE